MDNDNIISKLSLFRKVSPTDSNLNSSNKEVVCHTSQWVLTVVLTIPFLNFIYYTVLQPFVCEMHHFKIYIHWSFFFACWFNWM